MNVRSASLRSSSAFPSCAWPSWPLWLFLRCPSWPHWLLRMAWMYKARTDERTEGWCSCQNKAFLKMSKDDQGPRVLNQPSHCITRGGRVSFVRTSKKLFRISPAEVDIRSSRDLNDSNASHLFTTWSKMIMWRFSEKRWWIVNITIATQDVSLIAVDSCSLSKFQNHWVLHPRSGGLCAGRY